MEITHDILLSLGFNEVSNRPLRYEYNGVTGRLDPGACIFYFHGFSMPIGLVSDLTYLKRIIDYQYSYTILPYPESYN